jgi:hypothetical protein
MLKMDMKKSTFTNTINHFDSNDPVEQKFEDLDFLTLCRMHPIPVPSHRKKMKLIK